MFGGLNADATVKLEVLGRRGLADTCRTESNNIRETHDTLFTVCSTGNQHKTAWF